MNKPILLTPRERPPYKTIKQIRDLHPIVWSDARADIDVWVGPKTRKPLPDDVLLPPFGIDFVYGTETSAILTLSEPEGEHELIRKILRVSKGVIRIRYKLYPFEHEFEQAGLPQPIGLIPYVEIDFAGKIAAWGPRRYTMKNRHSFHVILTNLEACDLPNPRITI